MSGIAIKPREGHRAVQVGLDGPTSELGIEVVGETVAAIDREKLSLEVLAENTSLPIPEVPAMARPLSTP